MAKATVVIEGLDFLQGQSNYDDVTITPVGREGSTQILELEGPEEKMHGAVKALCHALTGYVFKPLSLHRQ